MTSKFEIGFGDCIEELVCEVALGPYWYLKQKKVA
jgi:hypothetical protein